MRILFVGNSLTYTHDLPGLLQALADSTGVERTFVSSVAFPNFALEDHWNQGDAPRTIARGGWRHVILQQGPSALEASRVNLLDWVGRFAERIRAVGAEPGMYMVWPSADRAFDFDRVSESYRLAAESVQGTLFPAGDAWRAAWRRDANLALYGPDGFHPSPEGTYLAAITIYARIYARSPIGLPTTVRTGAGVIRISAAMATFLQAAAAEALTQ